MPNSTESFQDKNTTSIVISSQEWGNLNSSQKLSNNGKLWHSHKNNSSIRHIFQKNTSLMISQSQVKKKNLQVPASKRRKNLKAKVWAKEQGLTHHKHQKKVVLKFTWDLQVLKKTRIKNQFLLILPEMEQRKTFKSVLLLINSWELQHQKLKRKKKLQRKRQESQELSILNFSNFIILSWQLIILAGRPIKFPQLLSYFGRKNFQVRKNHQKLDWKNQDKEKALVEECFSEELMDIQLLKHWRDGSNWLLRVRIIGKVKVSVQNQDKEKELDQV